MRPTDEQASKAYDSAPKAIQDALTDGPAIDFMVGLQARYSLHIDVAGSVIGRIRDLLLGLSNPTEFLGELIQLGLTDTVARTLVGDLNKEVFIPLREKMQSEPKVAVPVAAPEPITVPQQSLGAATPIPAPALDYAPAPTLPGSSEPVPVPAAPLTPPEQPATPPMPTVATPNPMPSAAPQQGWHSAAAVHIYVPSHGAPYQAPIETPAPEKVIDVAPSPSIEPEPVKTPPAPAPTLPGSSEPVPVPTPPQPLTKDYVADPYREPV